MSLSGVSRKARTTVTCEIEQDGIISRTHCSFHEGNLMVELLTGFTSPYWCNSQPPDSRNILRQGDFSHKSFTVFQKRLWGVHTTHSTLRPHSGSQGQGNWGIIACCITLCQWGIFFVSLGANLDLDLHCYFRFFLCNKSNWGFHDQKYPLNMGMVISACKLHLAAVQSK